jgi:hypothetical protein
MDEREVEQAIRQVHGINAMFAIKFSTSRLRYCTYYTFLVAGHQIVDDVTSGDEQRTLSTVTVRYIYYGLGNFRRFER